MLDYKTQVSTEVAIRKKCIDIYKYSILLDWPKQHRSIYTIPVFNREEEYVFFSDHRHVRKD